MVALANSGVAGPSPASSTGRLAGLVARVTKRLSLIGSVMALWAGLCFALSIALDSVVSQAHPWLTLAIGSGVGWTLGTLVSFQRLRAGARSGKTPFPVLEEAQYLMACEINRARRLQRPVGLVVLRYRETEQALVDLAHRLIRIGLRDMDVWALALPERELIVLAPETNRAQVLCLVGRLVEALPVVDRLKLVCATAVFPEDGLGLHVLLERARTELDTGQPASEPHASSEREQQTRPDATEVRNAA